MAFENWKFKEENGVVNLPEGDYPLEIGKATKEVSKTGKEMLHLSLFVLDSTNAVLRTLHHYIVFLPDRPEITNRNLTQLFKAFGLDSNSYTKLSEYNGKKGVGHIYTDESGFNKIKYFVVDSSKREQILNEVKEPEEDIPF